MLKLLFILPDADNQNILAVKSNHELQVPGYDRLVDDNAGFEEPDSFNEYFFQLTGIAVFRRYAFSYNDYCAFVLEPKNGPGNFKDACSWVKYDEAAGVFTDKTISEIVLSVRDNYNKSINMPWVNEKGLAPYLKWVNEIARSKGLNLTGEIIQLKNTYGANVFCITTSGGNLYLKIPGTIYIRELTCTMELMKWNITRLPEWLGFDSAANAILMKDMGGCNIPDSPDMDVLKAVIRQYAILQRKSLKDTEKNSSAFYDYRIETIAADLNLLPQKIYRMLENTQYKISTEELGRLEYRIEEAKKLLHSLKQFGIPDTVEHGDLRPGNIRITEVGYIFYDWAWSCITHPFIGISQFIHVIRRALPENVPARDILIESYLEEWKEYGESARLKEAFSTAENLKFLFMVYSDYHWLTEILGAGKAKIDEKSADGWLLARRYYYFVRVLKRLL